MAEVTNCLRAGGLHCHRVVGIPIGALSLTNTFITFIRDKFHIHNYYALLFLL